MAELHSYRMLQASCESVCAGAGNKETIRIVSVWQLNDPRLQADIAELCGEFRRSALTSSIRVGIEGKEDVPGGIVTELCELVGGEVTSESACGVAKAGLPKDGEIEEAFHEDDGGNALERFPRNQ